MTGYADYMMVLSPGDSICERVVRHKADAEGIIGTYESMHSAGQICIKNMPRRKPYLAQPEIMDLKSSLQLLPPVTLTIDGFDFFMHGNDYRTIYARIISNSHTVQWFKALKKSLGIKDYLVPHIAIARNIDVCAHNLLWKHFKSIKWVEDLEISSLTVLHRQAFDTFASWQTCAQMLFEARHLITPAPPLESLLKPFHGNYNPTQQITLF
jgi:hypothetical protein